jgi:hypothetical protein
MGTDSAVTVQMNKQYTMNWAAYTSYCSEFTGIFIANIHSVCLSGFLSYPDLFYALVGAEGYCCT